MKVRRVVTGHDGDGRAVFVSDEEVDGLRPSLVAGSEFHRLWGGDQTAHFPDDGAPPAQPTYFPPVGGFRFGLFTVAPDGQATAPDDIAAALAEFEDLLPGLASHMEPTAPGMPLPSAGRSTAVPPLVAVPAAFRR